MVICHKNKTTYTSLLTTSLLPLCSSSVKHTGAADVQLVAIKDFFPATYGVFFWQGNTCVPVNLINLKLQKLLVPQRHWIVFTLQSETCRSFLCLFHFCLFIFGHNVCAWAHVTEKERKREGVWDGALGGRGEKEGKKELEQIWT